jgi:hypothetical protein
VSWLRVALIAFAATLALLAGCVGEVTEDAGDEVEAQRSGLEDRWWLDQVPSSKDDPDHDHSSHADHANLTTPNFQEIGWNPLVTDEDGQTPSGMMCGGATTREDGGRIAIVHSISDEVAFTVADVTDPENPKHLGEVYLPNAVTWDADISADGMHVVVSAYPVGVFGGEPSAPPPASQVEETLTTAEGQAQVQAASDQREVWQPEMLYRDACTGETREIATEHYVPYGPGLVLFGIQDPSEPTFEDWRSQPVVGPHSVGSHEVDGTLLATASVTNLAHEASYYSMFEIQDTLTGASLVPYSTIRAPGVMSPELNGHVDAWVEEHSQTGQVLAYLANWNGLYVYDISTPQAPVEIGHWQDGDEGSMHTAYPFPETRDGRQYLIAGQEVGQQGDRPTGWIYLLDVTDPTSPAEVSRWTLPVKPEWDAGGLQFSTHYVDVYEDTMFVSVNHAGLWAVDISEMEDPRAIGTFVPDRPSPEPWNGGNHTPHVGDVVVDQDTGVITAWDLAGGVYQLTFDDQMPVEPAPKWNEPDVAN